jgi:hypothetical protein
VGAILLHDLEQRGVKLEADGSKLIVDAPADVLTDELLSQLRANKAELLSLLRAPADEPGWDAADWQAYFDERAGIREHDGGLPRADAESQAFGDAVAQWLCLNPVSASDPCRGCVHCGLHEQPGNTLLPVLACDGHALVHDQCWKEWRAARTKLARAELEKALRSMASGPLLAQKSQHMSSSSPQVFEDGGQAIQA